MTAMKALVSVWHRYRKTRKEPFYEALFITALPLIATTFYAFYNGILGFFTHSVWFATMCVYYAVLSLMRFFIGCRLCDEKRLPRADVRLNFFIGLLFLLLTSALSGMIVLTIHRTEFRRYSEITMITLSAYTFGKTGMAVAGAVRAKKQSAPLLLTLRKIRIAEVSVSMLSLQTAMLAAFPNDGSINVKLMTLLTGTAVSALLLFLGISMLIASSKTAERNPLWQTQNLQPSTKKSKSALQEGWNKSTAP